MKLVPELKRRNVFRMAALYAVAAWLIVQVVGVLIDLAKLPDWLGKTTLLLLAIGFPIALIFSWFYEITPEGVSLEKDIDPDASITHVTGRRLDFIVISLLCAALILFAYDKWSMRGPTQKSIAVLPFVNMSDDAGNEYFSDGISEELLNLLAKIPSLRVIARTSSFAFKGKNEDLRVVGSTLGVSTILEGSVRKSGDRVRITAQLIDVSDGAHIWSETYDRTITDIFEIQDDVATAIVDSLQIHVGTVLTRERPTESTEAHDFYLRGRDYMRQQRVETTFASAIDLFNRAIDLDPRFAQAYAGLCEAHLGAYDDGRKLDSFESAEIACQHALSLDDGLWEVHVALGNLYQTSGQYDKAIQELNAAISLQPGSADTYLVLAHTYEEQNSLERADATYRRAERVDSGYWAVHNMYGNFLEGVERYDEAIERFRKVIQLTPDSDVGYNNLGNVYLSLGNFIEAERAFSAAPSPSRFTLQNRGLVYYYLGEFPKAIEDHKRSIELAPESYSAWGHLGDAHRFVEGHEQGARDAYATAIRLAEGQLMVNPDDSLTIARLGMYYAYTGQADRAQAQIKKMLELDPELQDLSYYAARIAMQLGDMDLAYEYFSATIASGWGRRLILSDPDLVLQAGAERFEKL